MEMQNGKSYGKWSVVVLMAVLCLLSFYSSYQEVKSELLKESQTLFLQAVQSDTDRRIKELGDAFCFSYSGGSGLERDSITIQSADTVIQIKNNVEVARRMSSQEKQDFCLQHCLSMENPIQVTLLDSAFHAALHTHTIPAQTVTCYTFIDKTECSSPDTSFYQSFIPLKEIVFGANRTIVLQAYVQFPFLYMIGEVLSQNRLGVLVIVILWAIAIVLLRKRPRTNILPLQEVPKEMIEDLKKSKLIYWVVAIVISLLCGMGSLIFIQQSEEQFRERVSEVFLQSVFQDRDRRLLQSGLPFTFTFNKERTSDSVWITEGETVRAFERPSYVDSLTFPLRQDRAFQSVLRMSGYAIQVSMLDSIFRENLYKEGYDCRTAVSYRDTILGKNDYSVMDTASLRSTYQVGEIYTGVQDEILLKAYAFFSYFPVSEKSKVYIVLLWCVWLVVVVGLSIHYYMYHKRLGFVERSLEGIEDNALAVSDENLIRLTSSLCWDVKGCRLLVRGEEMPLTPQFRTMLSVFINSPEYFVSHDDLCKALWGKTDYGNKKDRLDQSVKRLRQTLAAVPDLEIENCRGKGYSLKIVSPANA